MINGRSKGTCLRSAGIIYYVIVSALVLLANIIDKKFSFKCTWCSKRASNSVPQRKILSVVVVVEQVVVSVVCCPVNDMLQNTRNTIVPVVNRYRPQIHKDKHDEVEDFVEGEYQRVDVVGEALEEAVDGVKRVAGVGGGDLPGVVALVDVLVEEPVVEPAVYPVDEAVREHEE